MNNQESIDILLAKYHSNEPLSTSEKKEFDLWKAENKEDFEQIERVLRKFGSKNNSGTEKEFDWKSAWLKIENDLNIAPKRKINRIYRISAIAASLLLCIGLSVYFTQSNKEVFYTNNTSENMEISLPDHSSVQLFPNSEITYFHKKDIRRVNLQGKAFFNVAKQQGKAFVVNTNEMQISVMGTSFLVDASDQKKAGVFVKTGIVKVSSDKDEIILKANQQAQMGNHAIVRDTITDSSLFIRGNEPIVLNFNNQPIKNVIEVIETTFNIKIEIEKSLMDNRITTRIENNKLDDIMRELAYLCNGNFKKSAENLYILYGN